jgi:hypothetical protein
MCNESRRNIIWLVAEDLSAIEIGSYGNAAAQTPKLDRLALGYDSGLRPDSIFVYHGDAQYDDQCT